MIDIVIGAYSYSVVKISLVLPNTSELLLTDICDICTRWVIFEKCVDRVGVNHSTRKHMSKFITCYKTIASFLHNGCKAIFVNPY